MPAICGDLAVVELCQELRHRHARANEKSPTANPAMGAMINSPAVTKMDPPTQSKSKRAR